MFKNAYDIYIETRAYQSIELNLTDESIDFMNLGELDGPQDVVINDMINNVRVGRIQWEPYNEHMYHIIKDIILKYEDTYIGGEQYV